MRSFLFVPAGSTRMLEKSVASAADVVILDLEDAVQQSAKAEARALLVAHLKERDRKSPKVAVRINGLRTPWSADDLAAIVPLQPHFVMLPKTEGPGDVIELAERMAPLEPLAGHTGILAVATETIASVLSLAAAPWVHPRLKGMLWGGEDLAADLGATANRTPEGQYSSPFRLARDLCLMAARRAGALAIDAVHTDLRDLDGLAAEAEASRRDGFDGKAAIHPSQVDVINAVFRPTDTEIAWARQVLEKLAASSSGIALVDGQMVDAPHAARAKRILAGV
ncbi:MAG: CoA ester lyase [Phreatobacter sp.]|uniref:HpcH/HpaI aldolase/citrate lyase family protein n=1 Tax=Phreatobacter sp. TaxID=1966341 RepID=UPI001A64232E|nr:CoA ester lyase [Phreatobacter sp.]MBL8571705.1 CoA ester lyase [Phreatobacter sp.]